MNLDSSIIIKVGIPVNFSVSILWNNVCYEYLYIEIRDFIYLCRIMTKQANNYSNDEKK